MKWNKWLWIFAGVWLLAGMFSCKRGGKTPVWNAGESKKIGIVLVNHGSRSDTWRAALHNLETKVKDSLLLIPGVSLVNTAFMEYTEPTLATQLKACDSAGVDEIIIIPVFLTVSSHSFDDIPTIIGRKEDPQSMETLKLEKIERYTPRANTHITPLLDFAGILKQNITRRVRALSSDPTAEGLILIGYGDAQYNREWSALFEKIAEHVKQETGIGTYSYGWCGHLVHYNPDSTTAAIERVLKDKPKAIVVPVLIAHDEMFQVKIIGDGIHKIQNHEKIIAYRADAILPDANVENWIKNISWEFAANLQPSTAEQ